ncbi:MAG: SpoIIE family protein phosphatase, partial [Planctomycetota bacterium]
EQAYAAETTVQPVAAPVEASVDTASLLPQEPPRVDGYEFEAVHKPSPAGANDFFDYIQIDDRHVGIVIADMPTAGPAGAFIATTFRAVMRAAAAGDASPASVLGKVNRTMAGELSRGDHITAMYTVLDTEKGIVSVASAGHLPLVFWKLEKKGSALLNPEGIAIGLDKGPVFEKTVVDKRIKLERGDRIVLYTDGPVAAKNMEGEEFGEQRFYYTVSREAPKNSAAFVNFVANEVDLFHEGAIQEDDITLVTARKL